MTKHITYLLMGFLGIILIILFILLSCLIGWIIAQIPEAIMFSIIGITVLYFFGRFIYNEFKLIKS